MAGHMSPPSVASSISRLWTSGRRRQARPATASPVKTAISATPTIMKPSASGNGPPGFHPSRAPRTAVNNPVITMSGMSPAAIASKPPVNRYSSRHDQAHLRHEQKNPRTEGGGVKMHDEGNGRRDRLTSWVMSGPRDRPKVVACRESQENDGKRRERHPREEPTIVDHNPVFSLGKHGRTSTPTPVGHASRLRLSHNVASGGSRGSRNGLRCWLLRYVRRVSMTWQPSGSI